MEYVNERPVAAQQTGWHFVAVMRRHLPDAVGGVSWCTADGSNPALACTTPYN
jgi:dipeptidase